MVLESSMELKISANSKRVLMIIGPETRHSNTLAMLLSRGIKVVGVIVCTGGMSGTFNYIKRASKKRGLLATLDRVISRLIYQFFNKAKDKIIHDKIFDSTEIKSTLENFQPDIMRTSNPNQIDSLDFIKSKSPDIIAVHTGAWIGKRIRSLANDGLVIGGHPGITPYYRGVHSAFWALYNNEPEMVGCTIFHVDKGVDTGDIINQERISIEPGDSYFSLGWKGMKRQAEMMVKVIKDYEKGVEIPRLVNSEIPKNSYYDLPKTLEYIKYRIMQRDVR